MGCETHFFFAEMENQLNKLIFGFLGEKGYGIIDMIERGERGTKVVEIFVDNEEGLMLDELAKLNRDLNRMIDDNFPVNDISKLVISSPGAERPFKYIWQLKKHLGRILEIEFENGEKTEGKLLEADEESNGILMIEVVNKNSPKISTGEIRAVNFGDIKEVKVKISFSK
ncbi:MAG: Ribosome maturation factor RimP [Ignavibacteria bacterium]|nr:Ribosome maturation factor RimP [Ignavibacteria bacterium]